MARDLRTIFEQRMEKYGGYRGTDGSGDSQDYAWWHIKSKRNTVTDHEKNDKGGYDRAGNSKALYQGATEIYNRKLNRYGNSDDESQQEYDLGRKGVGPNQRVGLTRSSIPSVTMPYSAKDDI